ncbi:MAG: endo-1,4-beta-xylanase [Draconibacterium sp.]|nr:endo-1,4-beta-xylanase [Draconibacterium sp.]
MKKSFAYYLFLLLAFLSPYFSNSQNTLPSCVITFPHCNAYFEQGTDVTIQVYASDLGGTYTGGEVTKVEFFQNDIKLGEAVTSTSNTYSFVWAEVHTGTYRITAKATDNSNEDFTSAGVIIKVDANVVKSVGLSANKGKYLANIIPNNVRSDFNKYWNGVTAENSCKWGSVESTRDVMNWTNADKAYNHAKNNNLPFRYHALAWGSQYPSWIKTLSPADFQAEMEEYMTAIAARYPLIDQIDVLNENMYINTWNKQEHAAGSPYFRAGMGGPGVTGYDWAIWLFEKARHYFPNSKLVINDFELETNNAGLNEILNLVKVLRDRGLIDGFGTQAHHFNVDGITTTALQNALNNMAKSGVPIYVTELDLKGKPESEANQMNGYKTSFPVYWNHPAVAGITLWGYVEGATWSTGTGILNSNGTERSAMTWLKSYMESLPDVGYPFGEENTTGIFKTDNFQSFNFYPNPVTNGKITVENNSSEILNTVEIINLQGKVVSTFVPTQSKTVVDKNTGKRYLLFEDSNRKFYNRK